MNHEIHTLNHAVNETFSPSELLHVATFKGYDLFYIYLNVYTMSWKLFIEKIRNDRSFKHIGIDEFEENSFEKLIALLDTIIESKYAAYIRQEKRWWSFLPNWLYLDVNYIHPAFIKYFQQNIVQATKEIDLKELNKNEQTTLDNWNKLAKNILNTVRHLCPVCSKELPINKKYPNYVCDHCSDKTTDSKGRSIMYYPGENPGELEAYYDDNGSYNSNICYVEGVKSLATVSTSGWIIIEKL